MATEGPFRCDGSSFVAGADLSANQFYAAVQTGSGTVGLQTTGGGPIAGIIQNKPKLNQAVNLAFEGISKAAAGAAVAAGAELMVDTTGRLITATSTNTVVGRAVESAGAAGVIFPARIFDTGYIKP